MLTTVHDNEANVINLKIHMYDWIQCLCVDRDQFIMA